MSMSSGRLRALFLLPALLLLGACATSRSYVQLAVPSSGSQVTTEGKVAVIETIVDQRTFEENPRDPSIPSLKKGASYALDAEGRLQAIARKRNGYGKAIGDIQLTPPQSVSTIVRDLVSDGLRQRGYRVLAADAAAPADALRVKVGIQEFWAWLTPGFWVVSMESKIKTSITFEGGAVRNASAAGYGRKTAPTGREDNWKQAYDRAFEDYLQQQKKAFDDAGL